MSSIGPQPISCGELPREPTDLEASLLVEPGAFSGKDFDEDAAVAAVIAQEPEDHEDWVEAVVAQVRSEYSPAVCDAISFSSDIGEASERPSSHQSTNSETAGQQHFALVLDASGSMAAKTGTGTRMEAARAAVTGFVERLPMGTTVSLRVYGQEGGNTEEDKAVSCASSRVVFEGDVGEVAFDAALSQVQPVGWTPLARAISLVPEDIPADATAAVVYVVTDGKETCDGDPVDMAQQLAADGVQPIINVVGFEAEDADQVALLAIAEAGNGSYVKASSVGELNAFWDEEYARLNQAWEDWQREEKARVAAAKEQLNLEVERIASRIRTAADVDSPHAQALVAALEERGHLNGDAGRAVDSSIKWYFSDVHTYAWGFEFDSNRAISSDSFDATFGASNDAFDAWREAYQEKVNKDE